jgi:DNA-binding XRE family transcriptional regulator
MSGKSNVGRKLGFLGDNVFYEDTGCKYAKELGYKGTCLPSKDYPAGCPFTIICLEDVHDTQQQDYRNQKIKELYYEQGLSQVEIAKAIGLSTNYVLQIVHDKTWDKVTRRYIGLQNA